MTKADLEAKVAELTASLEESRRTCTFLQHETERQSDAVDYYRQQLADAHALLGRVVHQYSERWDQVNLTQYFPTDNLWRQRTFDNPTGKTK